MENERERAGSRTTPGPCLSEDSDLIPAHTVVARKPLAVEPPARRSWEDIVEPVMTRSKPPPGRLSPTATMSDAEAAWETGCRLRTRKKAALIANERGHRTAVRRASPSRDDERWHPHGVSEDASTTQLDLQTVLQQRVSQGCGSGSQRYLQCASARRQVEGRGSPTRAR